MISSFLVRRHNRRSLVYRNTLRGTRTKKRKEQGTFGIIRDSCLGKKNDNSLHGYQHETRQHMPIVQYLTAQATKLISLHGQSSDQYLYRITATAIILITLKPLASENSINAINDIIITIVHSLYPLKMRLPPLRFIRYKTRYFIVPNYFNPEITTFF